MPCLQCGICAPCNAAKGTASDDYRLRWIILMLWIGQVPAPGLAGRKHGAYGA